MPLCEELTKLRQVFVSIENQGFVFHNREGQVWYVMSKRQY